MDKVYKLSVPKEWGVQHIEDIADISTGNKDTVNKVENGKYPFFVRSQTVEKINSFSYDGEAVLTAGDGVGAGKVFHYINGKFDFHQRVYKISDFKGIDGFFFFNYFKMNFLKQVNKYNAKTSVDSVRREMISKMEIPIPPVEEQKKISSILLVWDNAIEKKEKLIEEKKEQKKGLMQKLLFGHLRWNDAKNYSKEDIQHRNDMILKGKVPNGYKKTKRFIIPKDWVFVRIKEIADQITVKNKEDNNYVVLSCTKYDGLVNSLEYFGKQVFSDDVSKYKVVAKNQFAYATNHIEEGSIGLQREYNFGLVSPMYTVFEANKNVDNEFLFSLLKTENYRRIFETMMSASVDRRGSLRWKDFSNIYVPLPSLNEQQKISEVLSTANVEIEKLEQELKELKQQKKGLMQMLLTGKVRVKA